MPAAVPLFSITTGCPSCWLRRAASTRAIRSKPPPAATWTMNLIGRSGQVACARATATDSRAMAVARINPRSMRVLPISLRHVADRLDLEPAIERGPPGLHARARRQRLLAAEVAPVDAVELLLLALVLQPDDNLEQAVHVGAGGFDKLLQMIHHDPHLPFERDVGKRRDRLLVGARGFQLAGKLRVERRQPGDIDHVAVPDA